MSLPEMQMFIRSFFFPQSVKQATLLKVNCHHRMYNNTHIPLEKISFNISIFRKHDRTN